MAHYNDTHIPSYPKYKHTKINRIGQQDTFVLKFGMFLWLYGLSSGERQVSGSGKRGHFTAGWRSVNRTRGTYKACSLHVSALAMDQPP